jgi:hypothetical protein
MGCNLTNRVCITTVQLVAASSFPFIYILNTCIYFSGKIQSPQQKLKTLLVPTSILVPVAYVFGWPRRQLVRMSAGTHVQLAPVISPFKT